MTEFSMWDVMNKLHRDRYSTNPLSCKSYQCQGHDLEAADLIDLEITASIIYLCTQSNFRILYELNFYFL